MSLCPLCFSVAVRWMVMLDGGLWFLFNSQHTGAGIHPLWARWIRRVTAGLRGAVAATSCAGVVRSRGGDAVDCGGRRRVVPAAYYTAASEPVNAWRRDVWGVCQTCGRVACAGHEQVGEGDVGKTEIHRAASNGSGRSENSRESRIRRAWPEVAEYIRLRYGIGIKPVEIRDYEVKVTFPGDERGAVVNRARSVLGGKVGSFVEVIDGGPV